MFPPLFDLERAHMNQQQHTYLIATDGACNTNHIKTPFRVSGWGFVAIRSDGVKVERNGFTMGPEESNNTGELQAVIQALALLKPGSVVTIQTDSSYVLEGATKWLAGWKRKNWRKADGKPVANQHRWEEMDHLLATRVVAFEKVKGHSGHSMNERADKLAVAGMLRAGA